MGKVRLRIVIWSGPKGAWGKPFLGPADPTQRLQRLTQVVGEARDQWLDKEVPSEPPVLKMFVAPESLLVKSDDERAFAFDELKWENARFPEAFAALSQGLLLLPGTAIWKKPLVKGEQTRENHQKTQEQDTQRIPAYHERQMSHQGAQGLSANTQQYRANLSSAIFTKKLSTVHGQWQESDGARAVQIVRNVAYVYREGKRLLKYYKQGEDKLGKKTRELKDKDKQSHTDIKFIPGHKEGGFAVDVAGAGTLRCGLEICVDHAGGQLKFSESGKDVDLQFLLSDQIRVRKDRLTMRDGGYLVHASTINADDHSGLYDHQGNRALPELNVKLVDSELLCYKRELTV